MFSSKVQLKFTHSYMCSCILKTMVTSCFNAIRVKLQLTRHEFNKYKIYVNVSVALYHYTGHNDLLTLSLRWHSGGCALS